MGLENPLLYAVLRSARVATLTGALAASGCIVSPLDDITPSRGSKPSEVERMDAGSDTAAESDAGQAPSDAGSPDRPEPTEDKDAGSDAPKPAGRGGSGGRGGAGGHAGSPGAAGTSGAAGAPPSAGAAGAPEPNDKAIEEATRQYFERIVQRTSVRCDCYPDAPNRSVCNWFSPRKQHIDCMVDALQGIGAGTLDPLHCASDVELEWRQCYEQASCTDEDISACNQANLAERVVCDLPSDVFVDRCLGVYDGITAVDGFMQRASAFVQHICRCNPDGSIDPTTTCADTWHADTSPMTLDCVASHVYGLEARSRQEPSSPAISLLQCVNAALGGYAMCMDALAGSCDPAAQEQCSSDFTTRVTEECGAQGIGLFTCISPT